MTTIRKSIHLPAAPERVWAYLTEANQLAKWFHPADGDLAEGRDYALLDKEGEPLCFGTVREMVPHKRLVMSFTARPMNGLMTDVAWTLTEVPGGTRLDLEHSGLPAESEGFGLVVAFDAGWDKHLLSMREIEA